MQKSMTVLFLPETSAGQGTGHLKRCLALAPACKDASFLIPPEDRDRVLSQFPGTGKFRLLDALPEPQSLAGMVVVLDRPELSADLVRSCLPAFRLLALDARGPGATFVPLVVDLLPRLQKKPGDVTGLRNLSLPCILFPDAGSQSPPGTRSTSGRDQISVAVSFGGEDPASLRASLLASGLLQRHLPGVRVDIINGPATRPLEMPLPEGWRQIGPFPSLQEVLPDYDLLITSFGLTALEARVLGIRQIHLNPAKYHDQLSHQEGFTTLGIRKPHRRAGALLQEIRESLKRSDTVKAPLPVPGGKPAITTITSPASTPVPGPEAIPAGSPASKDSGLAVSLSGPEGFATLLDRFCQGNSHACPACSTRGNPVISRFGQRSFFACKACGTTYQALLCPQPIQYSESYFFDEYRAQYGKTYLEDFDHIKSMGSRRAGEIKRLLPGNGKTILDIGCAYGPFLAAAQDKGFIPHGCDISESAVAHVRDKLGMKAWSLDFRDPAVRFDPEVFDAVTLWYVIEHFEDLGPVLRSLSSLVRPGGILALATPSGEGISARSRFSNFLDKSPLDHYTIWNPSRAAKVLEPWGFRVERIQSTGHHPERFPGLFAHNSVRPLSLAASRLLGLGDTFEIYARRLPAVKGVNP